MLRQIAKGMWYRLTWSTKPERVSAPLAGTKFRKGRYLKQIWVSPGLQPAESQVFIGLGVIDTSKIWDRTGMWATLTSGEITARECAEILANALNLPPVAELAAAPRSARRYRLDLAITQMTPGSRLMQDDWLALIGLGHAWVQVEGILSELYGNTELIKFVERRRDPGFLSLREIYSWKLKPGYHLVRRLLEGTAAGILHELNAQLRQEEKRT